MTRDSGGDGGDGPGATASELRVLTNMVTPYVRVHLVLAGEVITAEWWNLALGVIPLRRSRLVLPLARVSLLRVRSVLFPDRLVVALGLIVVLYVVPLPWWGAALAGLGAVCFLLLSLVNALEVGHPGGTRLIPFCFWQRHQVAAWVRAAAARRAGGSGG